MGEGGDTPGRVMERIRADRVVGKAREEYFAVLALERAGDVFRPTKHFQFRPP